MSSALSSMTGYARAERQAGPLRVRIEIKSVNGRGLDIRLRLPPGLDAVEIPIRQMLSKALSRGSLNLVLTLDRASLAGPLRVNQQALASVLAAIDQLRGQITTAMPQPEGILALPGILESDDGVGAIDEDEQADIVLKCAAEAIDTLKTARLQEGGEVAKVLLGQVHEIESLIAAAQDHPSRSRAAIEAHMSAQLAALKQDVSLPQDRLAQEALLLATKADIQEELDRLRAHVAAARKLIAEGGPLGRRLDFLAQEFNREANTLCSKSNAVDLTAIGLDLKAVIDQLREQIQNIE